MAFSFIRPSRPVQPPDPLGLTSTDLQALYEMARNAPEPLRSAARADLEALNRARQADRGERIVPIQLSGWQPPRRPRHVHRVRDVLALLALLVVEAIVVYLVVSHV